jgi:RNA-directed DNA polymerase
LLANLYLHDLDVLLTTSGYEMVRYADDFVILRRSSADAAQALACVQSWVQANGLELHPDKTHIGDCRQKRQGFEFLGYRFEAGRRWVRKKSLRALKAKLRANTRRTCGRSIKQVTAILNPMLRGWFGYFRHADRSLQGETEAGLRGPDSPRNLRQPNGWRVGVGENWLEQATGAQSA